jgi:5-methylcytosine-specific restriction endonuclease McrA
MQRIMVFARLLRASVAHILALMSATYRRLGSWLSLVHDDLRWVACHTSKLSDCICFAIGDWAKFVLSNCYAFRRICNDVFAEYENNSKNEWAESRAEVGLGESHLCAHCDQVFTSKQKLSLHVFKRHGISRSFRKMISTLHCVACIQYFHTSERVLCHVVEKSRRCRAYYTLDMPELDENEVVGVHAQASSVCNALLQQVLSRAAVELPALVASGTLPQH